MADQSMLVRCIEKGGIDGFSGRPRVIETLISRVFIFDEEGIVLKCYKRDNEWWNRMRDISKGPSRIDFIRQDFAFNAFLNSEVYLDVKNAVLVDGRVTLVDPIDGDDELAIIMKKQDMSGVLTDLLSGESLLSDDYHTIGKSLASAKLSIPRTFLPVVTSSWYEQMIQRLEDLRVWVAGEEDFPSEISQKAFERLYRGMDTYKDRFRQTFSEDLTVLIDGNPENLIYNNGHLLFMDGYAPKDEWRIGSFDVDIFRTAADIYTFAGKDGYDSYMKGVLSVASNHVQMDAADFYLLYGSMIAAPYFMMLSKKNPQYKKIADTYITFLRTMVG